MREGIKKMKKKYKDVYYDVLMVSDQTGAVILL